MNKRELSKLRKWTDTLTNEELELAYYLSVFYSSYSLCDEMLERGYFLETLQKQEKSERYLSQHKDMLSVICSERKIKLLENKEEV